MSKIRLNGAAIPPKGWHFPQNIPNSDDFVINASNPADLETKVKQFRIDNGILPVGDPMADMIDYYVANYPTFVLGIQKGKLVRAAKAHRVGNRPRLLDRVAQWAMDMTKLQGIQYVYEEQSKQRAQICLACPKNRTWRTCPSCSDLIGATDRRINIVLGSRAKWPSLQGCQSSGHDNQAAVWLNSGLTRGDDAPEPCWVGKS